MSGLAVQRRGRVPRGEAWLPSARRGYRRLLAAAASALFALAAGPAAAIDIVEVTSPGGITAWLYEDHTIPIVGLGADILGGSALDPAGAEGAAGLMASLLDEGAGDLDATAFATAREELGARMSFWAGRDSVGVSAQVLADELAPSVELLRTALLSPRFDADALERARQRTLAGLRADAFDPDAVASRAFAAAAFPGHPYGRRPTEASVAALTGADLRAAHRSGFVRDRLVVAVAGAISPDELAPVLDRLFADLPLADRPLPGVATPTLDGATRVIDLDAPNASVGFGLPGIPIDDPDIIPATVLDHVIGGGFGSRLTTEIREKRGLTYGVQTWLDTGAFGQLYAGGLASANEGAAEAAGLVRQVLADVAEQGVTEAELEAARRYLTGAYPLRFVGTEAIVGQLLGIRRSGKGLDYVDRRNALVEAVTAEDVSRVARRIIDPARLTVVIAGRPEGLEAPE